MPGMDATLWLSRSKYREREELFPSGQTVCAAASAGDSQRERRAGPAAPAERISAFGLRRSEMEQFPA